MIYVIVGPTGSGKTKAAIKISELLNDAPIINGDAFQIYKDMNVGTAKISKSDPNYKKHYLLDIVSPEQTYSVRDYQQIFRETYDKIAKDHKDIIVCGGTGLYIKAALFDYSFIENKDSVIDDFSSLTNEELYQKLLELDPNAAKRIHVNNRKRVLRAVDIALTQEKTKSENIESQTHSPIYDCKFFFINPNREELYQNINLRVDEMIENGLVEEVKELLKKYNLSLTARQAIGYKEIIDYLEGKTDLESAIELIKKRTRNYAKRQVTFFKHQFETTEFPTYNELINFFSRK